MEYSVRLPNEPAAVPRARGEMTRVEGTVGEATLANARLLVSELVTNSVRHVPPGSAGPIELRVARVDGHLRVEVHDDGPGFAFAPRPADHDPGSGWGLHFLSTTAARWGVERDGGAHVWFELDDVQS